MQQARVHGQNQLLVQSQTHQIQQFSMSHQTHANCNNSRSEEPPVQAMLHQSTIALSGWVADEVLASQQHHQQQQAPYPDEHSWSEEEEKFATAPARPSQQDTNQQPQTSHVTNSASMESLQPQQQPQIPLYQPFQPPVMDHSSSIPGNLYSQGQFQKNVQHQVSAECDSTQANEDSSNPNTKAAAILEHQIVSTLDPSNRIQPNSGLYFDTVCEFSLFQNFLASNDQFISVQDHEQLCFEKLQVLQELIEALREEHNFLFKRLLQHADFNHKIKLIFQNETARAKIIKLMKSMTNYFLKYNSPKTFYEHPIVHNSVSMPLGTGPLHNSQPQQQQQHAQTQQQQTSARQFQRNFGADIAAGGHSMLQFGQQLHSEPSLDLLNFMNSQEEDQLGNSANNVIVNANNTNAATVFNSNGANANNLNNNLALTSGELLHTSTQEQIRSGDHADQLNMHGRRMHHYSQHVERQQNFLFNSNQNEDKEVDSPRLVPSNVNMFLYDEINLINSERLILIQIYSILIRTQMEQIQPVNQTERTRLDSQQQLQALNMIDMLLYSLCPTPSFQNMVIRYLLNPESGQVPTSGIAHGDNGNAEFPYQIFQPHRLSFHFAGLNSMLGSQMGMSSYEVLNDTIPDFETMHICDQQLGSLREAQTSPIEPNSFPREFECWDIRYQHSRLALVFKFWPFVENAMLSSSWNNVRAACYSVLSKAMLIPDVIQMSTNYQKRLKELLFPLLNKLLKSKECEGRAAGLNILGSLCGLSSFQTPSYRQSFEFSRGDDSSAAVNAADISNSHHGYGDVVFDCDQGQDYHYDRYEQRQREALGRNQIKIREHLHIFRRNSSFVSLAIWQEVFDMQEDWNEDIAKAAEVLTQLCAPKDSVKHFKKMSREKYQLRLCEVQNQLKQAYSSGSRKAFGQMSSQFAMQHLGFIGGSHAASLQSTGRSQINSRSELNGKQKHDKLVSKQTSQQQLTIQDRSEKSLIQLNLRQAHSGIISQKQLMSAHAGGTHLMQGGNTLAQTSTSVLFNQDFNMMSESIQATGRVNNGNAVGSGQAAGQQQTLNESSDSQSFEEFSAESEDLTGDELDQQAFYMEHFTERQLQQAVSLFSAEFKPISGLQAEQRFNQIQRKGDNKYRNGLTIGANSTVNSLSNLGGAMNGLGLPIDDEYGDGYGNLKNNILIDFFEDNMLEEVGSIDSFEDDDDKNIGKTTMTVSGTAAGTKDSLGVSSSERQQTTSQSDGDDLGIIDLDKQEGGEYDDFDQLDDEKLPVLKNTYSKKNRPNNSKSVAIGSRSQGDVLRIRSQALKVLKAADEEIKVQIKEHPEMLSSLQRGLSKKNQNPTSLEFQTQERLRYLDDHNLNYKAQAHDVLSSKSESAHRIQHKRRIQSGKWPLGECLSEDRLATERDRHSSHLSKTDSSNASQSTPMEIGDIQIAMRQEAQYRPKKVSAKKRQRQHNMAVDAENPSSDDLNEIRSQDNRKKRHPEKFKYNIGHFATSQKMVVGNLSEYDHSEKMSADDAGNADDEELQDDNELEYEVISAPVRRSKMARAQVLSSTNKLAHQSDKISVDSLTDLSPLADERCSSVMTGNTLIDREEEFTPKNSLDTRFQQRIMPVPTQKNSGMALTSTKLAGDPPANMNQQPQKNSQLISKKHQQQQQSQQMYQQQLIGTSQYLQGLNKQNFASNTCTSMSQPKLHQHGQKLSMNKMQTTQIKMPGRGDTSTKGSSKNQQPTTVSQNQPKMVVPHQRVDLNRGNDVPASSSDQQEVSGQANQTVSQKLVSLQKPVLNNAHSQQAIIQGVQPQKQQAHSGKVAGVKGKGINTDQANSFAPSGTSSAQAQQNQQTRIFREKRPSSLVVGHMPSEKNQQPNATKQNLKRNNFMMQQSPKAATLIGISNRSKPAKNKVISSQKEISMPEGSTRRRSQRTNKQPDIMKHQAAVHEEKKADDEHVIDGKHVPLQAQPETEKFEGFIDDDSDPVEDL